MLKILHPLFVVIILGFNTTSIYAEDTIELETTTITGNKELPKILYVVPWSSDKGVRNKEQKLQLHSLFGDLFDPVVPENTLKLMEGNEASR